MMTKSLDLETTTTGEKWVERTQRILSGFKRKTSNVRDPNIRIMTPKQALGCTADLVLLTPFGRLVHASEKTSLSQ